MTLFIRILEEKKKLNTCRAAINSFTLFFFLLLNYVWTKAYDKIWFLMLKGYNSKSAIYTGSLLTLRIWIYLDYLMLKLKLARTFIDTHAQCTLVKSH